MNAERHGKAFSEQIMRVARGEASDHDAHNRFYDEYLAVMDMTAEFYLSTVERIFKNREIARNEFAVAGKQVDIGAITEVAVMTVEGANDDISAPGQCVAALNLLTGLPDGQEGQHLEPGAGHYGIFAGKSWRLNIRPLVLNFIDAAAGKPGTALGAKPRVVAVELISAASAVHRGRRRSPRTRPRALPAWAGGRRRSILQEAALRHQVRRELLPPWRNDACRPRPPGSSVGTCQRRRVF